MLTKLEICNYAIIDHITIHFGPGLNILTGETGAGKSIVVGALGLLLGERFTSGILRKGEKEGYVAGEFDLSRLGTVPKIGPRNKTKAGSIVVKRAFTETSGSTCFINGKKSTVQAVKEMFYGLIDFHGQHQHQSLLHEENYHEIIDRYGKLSDLAGEVATSYAALVSLQREKQALDQKAENLREIRDYLEFQLKEIDQVNPQIGEEESLEQEWKVLQNADKIITLARDCYKYLYDNELSALAQIQKSQHILENLRHYSPEIESIEHDLAAAVVSIEEAAKFFQQYSQKIETDPVRLEEVNQRLMNLKQLQKKYKTDIAGILKKKAEIEQNLESEESLAEKIDEVSAYIKAELQKFRTLSLKLSKKRKETAGKLKNKILERLKPLGMGKSLFDISVIKRQKKVLTNGTFIVKKENNEYAGDRYGIDEIQFWIATGKAERFLPIAHIASGGELSRLMLAIKAVLMQADSVPTLVFDEIDTGISGRIAAAVGRELHNLAHVHQILCITHLPQIAAMAHQHFSVDKIEHNKRILTRVKKLDEHGRRHEIAKLLAGEFVKEVHLKSAEEMIGKNV